MKRLLATPPGYYRLPVLLDDALKRWPDTQSVNEIDHGLQLAVYLDDSNPATDQDWQNVVNASDPNRLTDQEQIEIQNASAADAARALFRGLGQLSPADATYAALARALAYRFGATQAEIDGITDRDSGAAYVTSTNAYQLISAPQIEAAATLSDLKLILEGFRQWQIATLDAQAIIWQAVIPLIKGR